MKIKKLLTLSLIGFLILSCSEDESLQSTLVDSAENAAVIRTIDTQNNTISGETTEGSLRALMQYTDGNQGALLDKLNLYVTFFDESETAGDSSNTITEEVLFRAVAKDDFDALDSGALTYLLEITASDFLNVTNSTSESIASGDTFLTRLELVLTDGRTFSFAQSDQFGAGQATFLFSTIVE